MTESTQHPVDLALRAVTATSEPSRSDFDHSRVKLMNAISTATRPRSQPRIRLSWATGIALVVVIAVFLVQTASTSPAEALITELAEVAAATDPLVIPDDQFGYVQINSTNLNNVDADLLDDVEIAHDSLIYSLSYTREEWIGDEATVRQRTTVYSAVFFSTADEAAYYAAGLDEDDHLGETIVETQLDTNRLIDEREWPTDPVDLEATIRSHIGEADTEVLTKCLELLREPLLSPELRAAVLRVIAGLDLELVDESPDGAATFSAEFQLEELGPVRLNFTIDATGRLVFEELVLIDGYPDEGVPPGIVDSTATYSVPVLVDNLP